MRGNANGALDRTYLHSPMTIALWYAVTEKEMMFSANMSHAIMLASMYGHPSANLDKGNDQIHEMYLNALNTLPYIKATSARNKSDSDALVEEWKRINADIAANGRKAEDEHANR